MFNFGYLHSPSDNFRSLNSEHAILKPFLTKYTLQLMLAIGAGHEKEEKVNKSSVDSLGLR